MKRLRYLDNLRWMTVVLVMIYHLFYIFNCSGVLNGIPVEGFPVLDIPCMFVYPWFMVLMYVISGMSARYALQKRTDKEFIHDRAVRILIPSLLGMLTYTLPTGWVGLQFAEGLEDVPQFVNVIIMILSGSGPLWFCHLLFVICLILKLVRKIDKNEKLLALGEKANLPILLALAVPVWLSSMVLIMPMITLYRLGIYGFSFLLGYYVISHENVQETLEKYAYPVGGSGAVLGIIICILWRGQNYTADEFLQHPFINLYLWVMVLGIIGLGRKFLNFRNKFTEFMGSRSQCYYLLHYTFLSLSTYFCITQLTAVPVGVYYIINAIVLAICTPLATEIMIRIPVLNRLLLGYIPKQKQSA